MKSVVLLDQFIGRIVVDIEEFDEKDAHQLNKTYIKLSFDDDSFICFPQTDTEFWYSNGE